MFVLLHKPFHPIFIQFSYSKFFFKKNIVRNGLTLISSQSAHFTTMNSTFIKLLAEIDI